MAARTLNLILWCGVFVAGVSLAQETCTEYTSSSAAGDHFVGYWPTPQLACQNALPLTNPIDAGDGNQVTYSVSAVAVDPTWECTFQVDYSGPGYPGGY